MNTFVSLPYAQFDLLAGSSGAHLLRSHLRSVPVCRQRSGDWRSKRSCPGLKYVESCSSSQLPGSCPAFQHLGAFEIASFPGSLQPPLSAEGPAEGKQTLCSKELR
ncbi:unnamed protein product [Natator depressus]